MAKAIQKQSTLSRSADRTGVLILGMHRSGTSALSRVLSLLGCDLPKTLIGANSSNEAGHWESTEIARLNDEILASAGSLWHDWLAFNPGWYSSPKAAEFREKALEVLADEFAQSRLFVLKDPRICRIAPFWLEVLEAAGVQPAIMMPVRNPLEVADSLYSRNGFDPALGHLLWLRHVLEAEAATRGMPRFHSSYDGLLESWPRLVSGTQEKLGVSWPRLSPLVAEEVDAFLTARLRHHRESPKSVSDNPLLSAWLRESYTIFLRWADEGESAADHEALDRIRAEFDGAAPAFARLISAGQQAARKAKSLDGSLKEAQAKLGAAEAAAAEQGKRAEALEQKLQSATSRMQELAETAERLDSARAELAGVQAEVEALRTDLDEVRGQLSHTQSALAQRSAEADDAAAQLQEAEQRLADELKAERARVAERFDEIASLSRMLSEKEHEIAAAQARSRADEEAARRRLDEAERAGTLAEELEIERARLAVRFDEIAALTRMLREKEEEASAALDRSRAEKDAAERRLGEAEDARRQESARAERLACDLETERTRASGEAQKLRSEKIAVEGRLSERFGEIAVMTRLLGEKEQEAERAEWLRQVSAVLLNGSGSNTVKGRLLSLLPASIRLAKQQKMLKRKGIFDADAYLAAYPDVADAGLDPLTHYIRHGLPEGRQLPMRRAPGGTAQDHE